MNSQLRSSIAIILTGIWVNASEFFRNEFLLKQYWVNHYQSIGMIFPSAPQNGMMWMIWGFLFAVAIYILSRKFNLIQATFISWLMGFVLMWLVILNLNVLPDGIVIYAVPLSLMESFVGCLICLKISPVTHK